MLTRMSRRPSAGRATISGVAVALALLVTLLVAPPANAATGILKGTLRGPDGEPISYFAVELYQPDGDADWALVHRQVVTSDSGAPVGYFEIAMPAGTYRACFRSAFDDTYEWAEATGIGCWLGAFDVRDGTDLTISEGGTTTIAPRLPPEALVQGTITGPGGVPVEAYVVPYRRAPDGSWARGRGGPSGDDGSYRVTDLDPGTYRFCLDGVPREFVAECWRNVAGLGEATELVVRPGASPTIGFSLARRATISGVVTPPQGMVADATVFLFRWANERWEAIDYALTGADGGYRIVGLDAGSYRLCTNSHALVTTCWRTGSGPAEAEDVVLTAGQQRRGINFSPTAAGFVTGTLPDVYLGAEGYPVVTAWRRTPDGWVAASSGEATPDGFGNDWTYQIGSLPAGTYVACVEHQEPEFVPAFPRTCTGTSPTPEGAEPFEVVAGATTSGIDIATGQAGEVRGRVTGHPGRVRVDLYTTAGRLALSQTTTAEGIYRFRELPSTTYYVGFHRETRTTTFAAEWWRRQQDSVGLAGATPVVVDGGVVSGISATLDPGGAITGRLVDSAGDPVVGCVLQARARDGSLAIRRAVTDAGGNFTIGGLSTASYVVLVTQQCSGAATGRYYDATSPTRTSDRLREADDVAVTRGRTTTLSHVLVTGVS